MQIITPARVYPVIVIGSGASGGMAAWNLTRQGIDVLLLDAGDKFDRAKFWTHVRPWQAQERTARGERPESFFLDTKEQPYVTPAGRPFALTRVWGHGGKTNVWGRVSLRYSQMDLKASERDGWEIPWPISYADISPYYDQVEQLIGVCGGTDDSDALPGSKFLQPPPGPAVRRASAAAGDDQARHPRGGRPPREHDPSDPRLSCLPLLRQLRRGLRHGILLLLGRSSAAVRDEDRQARDSLERRRRAHSHRRHGPRDRRAVLRSAHRRRAAGARQGRRPRRQLRRLDAHPPQLEGASATPTGSAMASDVIGRYLCEQIRLNVTGYLPALVGTPTQNDRGIGGEHIYMPRFNHRPGRGRDYLRGFGAQFWNTGASIYGAHAGSERVPGFGAALKTEIKRRHPAWFEIHPFGEVLPYAHNRITVDPSRVDRYGVPLPSIDYRIGENERKMTEHMADTVEEIVKASGGVLVNYKRAAARRHGVGDPRARDLPHGRRPEAVGAERVQPDARSEERVRRRRLGVSQRVGEEPDADHPGAVVARDGLSGGGDQARNA